MVVLELNNDYYKYCFYNFCRHWVSKHSADFWAESRLRTEAANFLEDIVCSPNLLPAEHRAAAHLLRLLARDEERRPDLRALLSPPIVI